MTSIDRDQFLDVLTRSRDIARELDAKVNPEAEEGTYIDKAYLGGVIQTYNNMIDLITTPEETDNNA